MKTVYITLAAALAGITSAQNGLPSCAQSCVSQFTSGGQIGGCQALNIACICSSPSFLSGIACCLAGACDAADQATAVTYAQNICKTAGVTVPDAVSCAASSATASSATASNATASSATATATGTSSAAAKTTSTSSTAAKATSNAGNMAGVAGIEAGIFGLAAVAVLL